MEGTNVAVMTLFKHGKLEPKAFQLHGRTVLLERVTLAYQTKDAGRTLWYFNVVSAGALHTLEYIPDLWSWRLVASWAPDE